MLWTIHDLTKDIALQRQLDKTDQVIDALNECYFELNNDYCFSYVNTMAEGFFEKRREELLGKNILEALPQLKNSALINAIVRAFEEGERTVDEFISPLKENWIYVSIAPTIDGVVVVFYDISEIKENQFFIEQVMEATPDFVSVFDLQKNKVIYINKAPYKQDINRYKETLTFNYNEILERAHPDDVEPLKAFIDYFRTAKDDKIKTIDYRVVDGTNTIWYRSRGRVFKRNEEGKPTQYLSIIQNITKEVL